MHINSSYFFNHLFTKLREMKVKTHKSCITVQNETKNALKFVGVLEIASAMRENM